MYLGELEKLAIFQGFCLFFTRLFRNENVLGCHFSEFCFFVRKLDEFQSNNIKLFVNVFP